MKLKEELYNQCKLFVDSRLHTVQEIISSNQKALQSETKSSAGDKHETGRAMLQLEMEKASQQLVGVTKMNQILSKIDVTKNSENAHLGSIVFTSSGNYFLSISAGNISVEGKDYFAVSLSSPIGKLLFGKKISDECNFNNKKIKVILVR